MYFLESKNRFTINIVQQKLNKHLLIGFAGYQQFTKT